MTREKNSLLKTLSLRTQESERVRCTNPKGERVYSEKAPTQFEQRDSKTQIDVTENGSSRMYEIAHWLLALNKPEQTVRSFAQ